MSFQTPTRPHATRENVLTTTFIHLRFESTSACFPQACTTNYVQWPSILDNSSSTISHHGTRRTAPAWTTSPGTRASGGSPCWGRRWWPSLPKRAAMARSMRSACTLGIDWHKRTMHICRARSYRAQRKKKKMIVSCIYIPYDPAASRWSARRISVHPWSAQPSPWQQTWHRAGNAT